MARTKSSQKNRATNQHRQPRRHVPLRMRTRGRDFELHTVRDTRELVNDMKPTARLSTPGFIYNSMQRVADARIPVEEYNATSVEFSRHDIAEIGSELDALIGGYFTKVLTRAENLGDRLALYHEDSDGEDAGASAPAPPAADDAELDADLDALLRFGGGLPPATDEEVDDFALLRDLLVVETGVGAADEPAPEQAVEEPLAGATWLDRITRACAGADWTSSSQICDHIAKHSPASVTEKAGWRGVVSATLYKESKGPKKTLERKPDAPGSRRVLYRPIGHGAPPPPPPLQQQQQQPQVPERRGPLFRNVGHLPGAMASKVLTSPTSGKRYTAFYKTAAKRSYRPRKTEAEKLLDDTASVRERDAAFDANVAVDLATANAYASKHFG